ncbi:RpiB/LacA/LacB family sugar-phosphate isomerase [Candidatus Woesearchaeota archaeon]|nr:RpiB/LacA/LacB family sugar-phosphate isomerase [Candidatus Woesearchaeota archaeon]
MKVFIGADHGGFELKDRLKKFLAGEGYDVADVGAKVFDANDDYVDYAFRVAEKVGAAESRRLFQDECRGVLLCRSSAGMVISANKVNGVRAVSGFDRKSVLHSREHNASNVLALSGDWTSPEKAEELLKLWLKTPFSNEERHARRLMKIADFEKKGL